MSINKKVRARLKHYAALVILLDEFRNKAGAWQSQDRARQIMNDLSKQLTAAEYSKLSTAWGHYSLGEGAEELYYICKQLIETYKDKIE